jgi:hypothetical protein
MSRVTKDLHGFQFSSRGARLLALTALLVVSPHEDKPLSSRLLLQDMQV